MSPEQFADYTVAAFAIGFVLGRLLFNGRG